MVYNWHPKCKAIALASIFACLFTGILTFTGCNADTRYKTLTFFFDGVPSPEEAYERDNPDQLSSEELRKKTVRRVRSFHKPYKEMKCNSCHTPPSRVQAGGKGVLLKTPISEGLCQECHETIPDEVKYIHAPTLVNDCLECHHHHQASYPKLLLRSGDEVCYNCHSKSDLSKGTYHEESLALRDTEDTTCVKCHDPHHGRVRYFLLSEEENLKAAEAVKTTTKNNANTNSRQE